MKKIVCFGEIMGRLNPEGYLRLRQAKKLELSFAGGEANVAVSLANFGQKVEFVTRLPDNELGISVRQTLQGYGVGISHIATGGKRLGMYYVEKGASQRPSKVIYDRENSSIAESSVDDFCWEDVFIDAQWFHFTGITPALSDNLAEILLMAVKTAKEKGITLSCDLNYRKNLWSQKKANTVMSELMQYVDICISNEEDAEKVFDIKADNSDLTNGKISKEGYKNVACRLVDRFGFNKVAITLRGSISASDNNWAGILYDGKDYFESRNYSVHIVDRIGGGDSFGGGLIYALVNDYSNQEAIDFAVAASCLKQTIEFDFNQVTVKEVQALVNGDGSGRVSR